MYRIINYADYDAGVKEYVVETIAEMNALICSFGSTAFCLETMSYYIRDSHGAWREIA